MKVFYEIHCVRLKDKCNFTEHPTKNVCYKITENEAITIKGYL